MMAMFAWPVILQGNLQNPYIFLLFVRSSGLVAVSGDLDPPKTFSKVVCLVNCSISQHVFMSNVDLLIDYDSFDKFNLTDFSLP